MSYCRYCGVEITYKRSRNDKWIPCDVLTGEPHFCQEKKKDDKPKSGITPCPVCGKPLFITFNGKKKVLIDYTTLVIHQCLKSDITRYAKYKQKQLKDKMSARSATLRSKKNS
jgi:hypothetical protein